MAKLDRLSARSSAARAHLARTTKLAARAKQAILCAAFDGRLTEEWRAASGATGWTSATVGALVHRVTAGKNLKCEERPPTSDEQGVVKVSAVTWGRFDPEASKTLPNDFTPQPATLIRSGDLLFSRANTIELVPALPISSTASTSACWPRPSAESSSPRTLPTNPPTPSLPAPALRARRRRGREGRDPPPDDHRIPQRPTDPRQPEQRSHLHHAVAPCSRPV